MKKFFEAIGEYKEVLLGVLSIWIFFLITPFADPWTAGVAKDWLFRLPIAATLLFLTPTVTHLIYIFTYTSGDPAPDYYSDKKRLNYAIITLGVLIFFSSLL